MNEIPLPYEQTNMGSVERFITTLQGLKRQRYEQSILNNLMSSNMTPEGVMQAMRQTRGSNAPPTKFFPRLLDMVNPGGSYNGPPTGIEQSILGSYLQQAMQDPLERQIKQAQLTNLQGEVPYRESMTAENLAQRDLYRKRANEEAKPKPVMTADQAWDDYRQLQKDYANSDISEEAFQIGANNLAPYMNLQGPLDLNKPPARKIKPAKKVRVEYWTPEGRKGIRITDEDNEDDVRWQIEQAGYLFEKPAKPAKTTEERLPPEWNLFSNQQKEDWKNRKASGAEKVEKTPTAKEVSDFAYNITHTKKGETIQPEEADLFALQDIADKAGLEVDVTYTPKAEPWFARNTPAKVDIKLRKKTGGDVTSMGQATDQFGFTLGETKTVGGKNYEYIGDNKWESF